MSDILDGKNVYNRKANQKPVVRIGNWVEERAQWEQEQKLKISGSETRTAANTIADLSVDQKAMYATANSQYGNSKPRYAERPVERKPKVSVIKEKTVTPYKTKKAFEAHLQAVPDGHDLLNRDPRAKGLFETTTGSTFFRETTAPQVPFEQRYDEAVTFYNPNGSVKRFGRNTTFTQPINQQ